uniref:Uncharacterized protein n=1 Tax=Globodera rostochiensis TaxID=31243 RepID=A0A914I725_GLORO
MKNTEQIRKLIASKFVRIFGYVQLPAVILGAFYYVFYDLHKNQKARQQLHTLSPTALKFFYSTEDFISGVGTAFPTTTLAATTPFTRASDLSFKNGVFGKIVERYLDSTEMDPIAMPSWKIFVSKEQEEGRELTLPITNILSDFVMSLLDALVSNTFIRSRPSLFSIN